MGLSNLAKRINGSRVSRGQTCGSRALYAAFSNNKKVVTILHREPERKAEKVKMLEVTAKDQKQYEFPA